MFTNPSSTDYTFAKAEADYRREQIARSWRPIRRRAVRRNRKRSANR